MGSYLTWLVIVGFTYFCYTKATARPLGGIVIVLISISLLYNRITLGVWGDAQSSFAYMLMIGVACILGHLNHQRTLNNKG
jgi:hypothetical protein